MWYVYLIACGRRTYVGCTTDPVRRLRQHNRELVGGAKSTARGAPNWIRIGYVFGFQSRSEAYRWERLVKGRARGLEARRHALKGLPQGFCPEGSKVYVVPRGLIYVGEV